jgi:hypothetical protein
VRPVLLVKERCAAAVAAGEGCGAPARDHGHTEKAMATLLDAVAPLLETVDTEEGRDTLG